MSLNTSTLGEIKENVKRQFGDESGYQLEESDITRWANQAQMEIVSKNKILRSMVKITNTADFVPVFAKPDDALQVNTVQYDGNVLEHIGFDTFIDKGFRIDGEPNKYDGVVYWTQLADNIYTNGRPLNAKGITVVYVPEPDKLVNDGDVIAVPDRYFNRIIEYVLSKAYEMDEDWEAQQAQQNTFESNLLELNHEESNTRGPYPVVQAYYYE